MSTTNRDHSTQTIGYWITYFAERIRTVIHDDQLSWAEQIQWLGEVTEDLDGLAQDPCAVSDDNVTRACRLAQAMQAFIFHRGPNPDDDASFVIDTQPIADPAADSPDSQDDSAAQIVLIPYIDQESGAAEVWIGGHNRIPLLALADFSGCDPRNPEDIQAHCDDWGADRILLPTDETPRRWTAYTIDSVIAGQLVEAM